MRRRATWIRIVVCALGAVALSYGATAFGDTFSDPDGVPRLIPFRGHLELAGAPVASPTTVEVSIYDSSSGGTPVWGPEMHTVTPAEGDFSIMLGETVPLDPASLAGGDAWVETLVEGVVLSGRQRLASAPYALRADRAVHADGPLRSELDVLRGDVDDRLLDTTDTLDGDLTVTGDLTVNGTVQVGRLAQEICAWVTCTNAGSGGSATCACPADEILRAIGYSDEGGDGSDANRIDRILCCSY